MNKSHKTYPSFSALSLLLLALLLFSVGGRAQDHKSAKADKLFKQAVALYRQGAYQQALQKLDKAEKADPSVAKLHLLRGDIYADRQEDSLAALCYRQAVALQPKKYARVHALLGAMYMSHGQYDSAKIAYERYLAVAVRPRDSLAQQAARQAVLQCTFALHSLAHPLPFEPYNLGEAVNTTMSEYFPALSMYNSRLWFTRRLQGQGQAQEDFFFTQPDSAQRWLPAQALPPPLNTPFNEGAASLSADGRFLVFAACAMRPGPDAYGAGRQGYGSCDLFCASYRDGQWLPPQNMGKAINSALWESQPSLSADGRSLYFIRATDRSKRNTDIYVSHRQADGQWTVAQPLPKHINTAEEEMSVMIHPNNCALYFASKGHIGMGGADIFVCRRANSMAPWGKPQNAGYPINTYKDENGMQVSHNGHTAFFASDREGGYGGMDIYAFELPVSLQASPMSYLDILVVDAQSEQALQAQISLVARGDSSSHLLANTDSEGHFFASFAPSSAYAVHVDKPGYLFYSDTIALAQGHTAAKPYRKTIALQPIQAGVVTVLNNIFFDTDASTLKAESSMELNKLLVFLQTHSAVKICVEGHTDARGGSAHNQELSEARAKTVVAFLVAHGIAQQRLSYKGYGASRPVAENSTAEGRARNRRTAFVVR